MASQDKEIQAPRIAQSEYKTKRIRLEWAATKDLIESITEKVKYIKSPKFNVNIDGNTHYWYIDLYPKGYLEDSKNDEVAFFVHIMKNVTLEWEETAKLKYDISIKSQDGSLKKLSSVTEKPARKWYEFGYGSTSLFDSKDFAQFYVNDKIVFVIDATISIEKKDCLQNEGDNLIKYKNEEGKATMAEHFAGIQKLAAFSDLAIFCEDQKFLCHKAILASRSTILREFLENEKEEKIGGDFEITDTSPCVFKIIIDHIYTGEIDYVNLGVEVFQQAVKYKLPDLIKACEISLLSNLTEENSLSTLITIDSCRKDSSIRKDSPIRKDIVKFISMNVLKIMTSDNWKSFAKDYPDLMSEIIHCLATKINVDVLPTIQRNGAA